MLALPFTLIRLLCGSNPPEVPAAQQKSPRDLPHGLREGDFLALFPCWGLKGFVRRAGRCWGGSYDPLCLRAKLALLSQRHAVVKLAGAIVIVMVARVPRGTAATAATAATVVAVAIARILTIGRIAVEVAPIALAATGAAPRVRSQQSKQATQRSAMPNVAAIAVAAGIAARIATAAVRCAAWLAASGVAATVAIGNHRPSCRSVRLRAKWTADWSADRSTALVASLAARARIATTAGTARTAAEDRLEQSTAGAGRHHAHKQTEKQDPFHDFLPLLLQPTADFR
jgi:hypothetical protein